MAVNGNSHSADIKPRDVCIVGIARTPIGGLMGSLSSLSATELGAIAIKEAVKRSGVDPKEVQEVFMGNVIAANLGQAPARQAALGAGLPASTICTTLNKVCASGMKATMLAAQSIMLGINECVVAGGMESMSNAPHLLAKFRQGCRLGKGELLDSVHRDGLYDALSGNPMGDFADACAEAHSISREQQDDYAVGTYERAISAQNEGAFEWEIVPVEVKGPRGKPATLVAKDEDPLKFDAAKLRTLRACFKGDGTVTPGNASGINDGAAALVLLSADKAKALGITPLAVIRGFADAEQEPKLFTTSPSLAIPKALLAAGLSPQDVDFYEINEAFSVVALANQKLLGLDLAKLNAHGGAVALGHPLGCSGARILITLLGVLKRKGGHVGVAGVCNGGGGASAMVLQLL